MKTDLRIVFMGTPEFAVTILKSLIEHGYNIVGVITAPDKPAGRGMKLHRSAVKEYALANNLHVMQPKNLKDETFIEKLKALQANLQVVVAFRMLPKVVWQMPELGTFNLHASLLPQYRGAAPINWAIINGETKTGVSTFFIDDKIDTGDMILQDSVSIGPTETAGELHDKLMYLGSDLVLKTIKQIETATVSTIKQSETEPLKTAYKLNKENCRINWNASAKDIINLIRGLNPYPAAWSILKNNSEDLNIKIYNATFEAEHHNFEIGHIISTKHNVSVAVKNGVIHLLDIKLPGKRRMDIKSLLNGYGFNSDAKVF